MELIDIHEFRNLRCSGCGAIITVPVYCGDRFCPLCSQSRRCRIEYRLNHLIKNRSVSSGYGLKHLTLTIPNRPDAGAAASEILAAFRRLRQRKQWKSYVSGGAFVLEITGRPLDWHVHIHAIIDARFFPWEHLHALWQKVSSGRGLYIQRIPAAQVVRYLLKYITKTAVSDAHRTELAAAFRGKRMFQPFGSWHSVPSPPPVHPCYCKHCGGSTWLPESFIDSNLNVLRRMKLGRLRRERAPS